MEHEVTRVRPRWIPYSNNDVRVQREERARFQRWQQPDWLQSVEDVIFQHTMFGVSEIHFSGDHRPDAEATVSGESRG